MDRREPVVTPDDAKETLRTILAAHRSSREAKRVLVRLELDESTEGYG